MKRLRYFGPIGSSSRCFNIWRSKRDGLCIAISQDFKLVTERFPITEMDLYQIARTSLGMVEPERLAILIAEASQRLDDCINGSSAADVMGHGEQ